jgi:hemerythrin-like domain-containing protein
MSTPIEDPVRHLRDEHDSVLEMIDHMEVAASDLAGPRRAEALQTLRQGLDFLKQEVAAHMKLEETVLYPALAKHVPAQMVTAMLDEHRDISWALALLEQGLESGERATTELRWHAISVVDLMRRHIDRENNVLFMMTAQMLSAREYEDLTTALHGVLETRAHHEA